MSKFLFYLGTAFCMFLALTSAAELTSQWRSGAVTFGALGAMHDSAVVAAGWAILVALIAGGATAAIFIRMASLLAPRNLFGAFLALFSTAGAMTALASVMFVESRMVALIRRGLGSSVSLTELHFAAAMTLGYFLSLALLTLRPYFRIQASRTLSALVFFPMPLFLLILAQELFAGSPVAAMPPSSPASLVFFAVMAVLFFAIAIHCIRHRHLFLELTNLRELLDPRVDPASRGPRRPIGGVAFDS